VDELARLFVLLAVAGLGLTLLGGVAIWHMGEARRIRRGLRHVLGADPNALLVARGRGRGVGFNFANGKMAVAWDAGGWCLIYRIDELIGAELIIDGQVTGRVYRGEARRAVDLFGGAEKQVRLRLVFNDPAHPDFDLDLWLAGDEARARGKAPSATEAVQEANRWLSRTESLLRRMAPAPASGVLPMSNAAHATASAKARAADPLTRPKPKVGAPAPEPAMNELPFAPIDDDLPWEMDEPEDERRSVD